MPSWQWSYPYNDTDSGTVLFEASPASALCHWRVPLSDVPEPRQVYARTLDGGVRCYELGDEGRTIELSFDGLPEGSDSVATELWGYLGIKKFLTDHVSFGMKTFGFYDHAGSAEVELRYLGGIETFKRGVGGVYSGTIRLAKERV